MHCEQFENVLDFQRLEWAASAARGLLPRPRRHLQRQDLLRDRQENSGLVHLRDSALHIATMFPRAILSWVASRPSARRLLAACFPPSPSTFEWLRLVQL